MEKAYRQRPTERTWKWVKGFLKRVGGDDLDLVARARSDRDYGQTFLWMDFRYLATPKVHAGTLIPPSSLDDDAWMGAKTSKPSRASVGRIHRYRSLWLL